MWETNGNGYVKIGRMTIAAIDGEREGNYEASWTKIIEVWSLPKLLQEMQCERLLVEQEKGSSSNRHAPSITYESWGLVLVCGAFS